MCDEERIPVVGRKCDASEVARVAIADAGSAATLGGG